MGANTLQVIGEQAYNPPVRLVTRPTSPQLAASVPKRMTVDTPSRPVELDAVELRLLAGLRHVSAAELARRSGLDYDRVAGILAGRRTPRPAEMPTLRRALFGEAPRREHPE
jgi:hypothetical protein